MIQSTKIEDDFISASAGRELDGKPHIWTSFYYYKGLVIDSGCAHTAEESTIFLEKLKLPVKAILLTHYHEDHCGGATAIQKKFKVEIYAPEKSLNLLAKPPQIPRHHTEPPNQLP